VRIWGEDATLGARLIIESGEFEAHSNAADLPAVQRTLVEVPSVARNLVEVPIIPCTSVELPSVLNSPSAVKTTINLPISPESTSILPILKDELDVLLPGMNMPSILQQLSEEFTFINISEVPNLQHTPPEVKSVLTPPEDVSAIQPSGDASCGLSSMGFAQVKGPSIINSSPMKITVPDSYSNDLINLRDPVEGPTVLSNPDKTKDLRSLSTVPSIIQIPAEGLNVPTEDMTAASSSSSEEPQPTVPDAQVPEPYIQSSEEKTSYFKRASMASIAPKAELNIHSSEEMNTIFRNPEEELSIPPVAAEWANISLSAEVDSDFSSSSEASASRLAMDASYPSAEAKTFFNRSADAIPSIFYGSAEKPKFYPSGEIEMVTMDQSEAFPTLYGKSEELNFQSTDDVVNKTSEAPSPNQSEKIMTQVVENPSEAPAVAHAPITEGPSSQMEETKTLLPLLYEKPAQEPHAINDSDRSRRSGSKKRKGAAAVDTKLNADAPAFKPCAEVINC